MEVHVGKRGKGKTTELAKWTHDGVDRIMVVFSRSEQLRVQAIFPSIKERVFTWEEYVSTRAMGFLQFHEVCIDNLDIIVQRYCKGLVRLVTVTTDEQPDGRKMPQYVVGLDKGKAGDTSSAVIMKIHPDGTKTVVHVDTDPYDEK